ncbi:hypothetical protein Y032_0795g2392, partial [Ancylostoma ceylanicum]
VRISVKIVVFRTVSTREVEKFIHSIFTDRHLRLSGRIEWEKCGRIRNLPNLNKPPIIFEKCLLPHLTDDAVSKRNDLITIRSSGLHPKS